MLLVQSKAQAMIATWCYQPDLEKTLFLYLSQQTKVCNFPYIITGILSLHRMGQADHYMHYYLIIQARRLNRNMKKEHS